MDDSSRGMYSLWRGYSGDTHSHVLPCRFSRGCLAAIRHHIRFAWPNREWTRDVEWASRKWRGKHIVNVAYRALLGACIYHIWRERNLRRFEHTHRPEAVLATCIIEDVRQRIISINLSSSISTCALYRLWRIPWSVGGTTIWLLYFVLFTYFFNETYIYPKKQLNIERS